MYIYKIINLINQKIYIGKTTRKVETRWEEHKRDYLRKDRKETKLYRAFKKYGIENFSISTIESNIDSLQELNEKEMYYINLFNSCNESIGYNITKGGDGGRTNSKLSEEQVKKICLELLDNNNNLSMYMIAKKYNISYSAIYSINKGESWYNPDLKYPLRVFNSNNTGIERKKYKKIIEDILKNSTESLSSIAKRNNISEDQMRNINQGHLCYNNNNEYYKGIYNGKYPIRDTLSQKQNISQEDNFVSILYDVLFTKMSIVKIGEKYNIPGNTITCIMLGKRRKELTKDFIVPIRKNLKENQLIFKQIFTDFQGGD